MAARRPVLKNKKSASRKATAEPQLAAAAKPATPVKPYSGITGNPAEQVVVVKVHRASVGAQIPFDKIYLFPKSATARIPRIFGYALVLPMESSLISELCALPVSTVSHFRDQRDDATVKQPVAGFSNTWWPTQIFSRYKPEDHVVVVPILTSALRKKINPAYLMSQKWFDASPGASKRSKKKSRFSTGKKSLPVLTPIGESAYLATPLDAPHDKISPICGICPRLLMQMQGECQPGQMVCLKTLDFNAITTSKPVPAGPEEPAEEEGARLGEVL